MSNPVPPQQMALDAELAQFREDWKIEVSSKAEASSSTSKAVAKSLHQRKRSAEQPVSRVKHGKQPSVEVAVDEEKERREREKERILESENAVEIYAEAVEFERQGRLNEALAFYRKAFKLDEDVDRAYDTSALSKRPPPSEQSKDDDFHFSRTIHLGPEYSSKSSEQALAHPSSTQGLTERLMRSFSVNPYPPPPEPETLERQDGTVKDGPTVTVKKLQEDLSYIYKFHPRDEELPLRLRLLPADILILIFTHLVCGHGAGLERATAEGVYDVQALERFGSVSRWARLLTLETMIWKNLCEQVYVPPQISILESPKDLVEQHGNDWRRMYIEQPRLRTDGCFIAVITYFRKGSSENAWVSPTLVVTFFRYFRFLPNGVVVTCLTTEDPQTIVRKLNPSLKIQGTSTGRWRLQGDRWECYDLADPGNQNSKYTFRMSGRLSSTQRGKMNKLELENIQTENRRTHELADIPLKHMRPFYFSRVKTYSLVD
ncbi:hypothetical protein BT69DRAFT_1269958 [Atractiella rhizophila]|nr:hypothetical protein BT69DRAFT_1269958 [Atractiella rhizophila]